MSATAKTCPTAPMPPKLDKGSKTVRMQLVLPQSLLTIVEEWRATQRPVPNVSEAIRRLIEMGVMSDKRDGQKQK